MDGTQSKWNALSFELPKQVLGHLRPSQQSWGYEQEESTPMPMMAFCMVPADQMQMPLAPNVGFYPAMANPTQGSTQGSTQWWQQLPVQQMPQMTQSQMTQMTQMMPMQHTQPAQMQQLQPMQPALQPMQQAPQPVQQLPLQLPLQQLHLQPVPQMTQMGCPASEVPLDGHWAYASTPEQCCAPDDSNAFVADEVSTAPSEASPRHLEARKWEGNRV